MFSHTGSGYGCAPRLLAKLQVLAWNPNKAWKWYEARIMEGSIGPMFRSLILLTLALSACVARPQSAPVAPAPATSQVADTVTVHLSNFAFTPENIRLQAGRPVTLVLINDADGGHNFSAPTLFAASTFPPGTTPPKDGAQEVDQHSRVELRFTPKKPGHYEVTCTHFLHELFGMVGNVEVVPAS